MSKNGVVYDLRQGFSVEEVESPSLLAFERAQKGFTKGFIRVQPANQVIGPVGYLRLLYHG